MRHNLHKKKSSISVILILLALSVAIGIFLNNLAFKVLFPNSYYDIVEAHATKNNIDPLLVLSLIKAESNFNPNAASSKDARGLMQIQPDTATWCASRMGLENFDNTNLYEPEINITIGCYYFSYLYEKYQNIALTLTAYNAGEGNVAKWQNNPEYSIDGENLDIIPFNETDNYVKKINKYYTIYKTLYRKD